MPCLPEKDMGATDTEHAGKISRVTCIEADADLAKAALEGTASKHPALKNRTIFKVKLLTG